MSILFTILIGIGVLITLLLIIALFAKKSYTVWRETTINRHKQEVFDYIKFLRNQDNFSKWATMDPDMKKSYRGTDGQVGFVSAWESQHKNVGVGEQEIKKITEGDKIEYELRFKVPFESTSDAYLATESISNNQTKVTWGFEGHMKYPMNLMILFMNFDKMIGADFEEGLSRLKGVLEK